MKKNRWTVKLLFLMILLLLSACSDIEKVEHIEAFVTETSEENAKGLYEKTGYKKVNSVSIIEKSRHYIKTDVKAIEDFYDTEGHYIKTKVIHSNYKKSYVTRAEDGENQIEELQEPSTILIPDEDLDRFQKDNLTSAEKEKVKKHVLSYMEKL